MIEHVKGLKRWETIERPVYDFTIHNRVNETVAVKPAKVVVVEGILIFENKELLDPVSYTHLLISCQPAATAAVQSAQER